MRTILGIDYGTKRIGVAIARESIAFPYGIIETRSEKEVLEKIRKICEENEVQGIVIGKPVNLLGQEKQTLRKIEKFTKTLISEIKIPIYTEDESYSTFEAKGQFLPAGATLKKYKDGQAAQIILQRYLDHENHKKQ